MNQDTCPRFVPVLQCFFYSVIILISLISLDAHAHRGPADEIDDCRIMVGFETIHFTAYTPTFTQSTGFCQAIPNIGPTNLVFDYEGHKLRDVTVEFEITKEPEGTRIYYQEPKKIKTGTVNAMVDFSNYGAGDYLAHITIMNDGEKLDSHLPFAVGVSEQSSTALLTYIIPILIIAVLLFFMFRGSKAKAQHQE